MDVLPPKPTSLITKPQSLEEAFIQSFLSLEGDKLTPDVFGLLFDFFHTCSTSHKPVTNVNFFVVFLKLLKRCEKSLQVQTIQKLHSALSQSATLLNFSVTQDWLKTLLAKLPNFQDVALENLILVIKLLASNHVCVRHVKEMFKLFQNNDENFKSYYWSEAFKLMSSLWSVPVRPLSYFEFEGNASGIIIPPIKISQNGFSFFTWIRVSDWSNPFLKTGFLYQPHIYAFGNDVGTGVRCYYQDRQLQFSFLERAKTVFVKGVTYKFLAKQWYFIGIVHKPGFLLGRSNCSLFVNGKLVENFPLSYPKSEKPFTLCRFGISSDYPENPANSFRGQMAGFCLIDDALADETMEAVYVKGCHVFANIVHIDDVLTNQRSGFLKGSKPKITFFYSPQATEGRVLILDCQSKDKAAVATKFGFIEERTVASMPNAFSSVGGITVLIPLFSRQLRPKNTNHVQANIQLITLITQMIKGESLYQEEMYRTMFFPIMGHLLTGGKDDMWSKEAINAISSLASVITHQTLFAQLHFHILLNFEIWASTSFAVQQELFRTIQACASENVERFRSFVTVDHFMDILDKHYSSVLEDEHGLTTKAQRRELRFMILSIIRSMVQFAITGDETRSIILYIQRESKKPANEQQCIDVLQLLVTLLSQKIPGIYQNVEDMGYFNVFLSLLQKENELLFIWALKILGTLLIGENPNSPPDTKRIQSFNSVKKYLEHVPFTTNLYYSLLEISIGNIALKGLENLVAKHKAAPSETIPTFRVPGLLKIIFSMMLLGENKDLNLTILQDMEYLLILSQTNRRFFLSQRLWQSWLLGLLAKEHLQYGGSENSILMSVIRLFATLHHHALFMKGGHKVFRQSSGMIHHFHGMGFLDQTKFLRLLHQTFAQMSHFYSPEGQTKIIQKVGSDPMLWRAATDWLLSVDDFLFCIDQKVLISEYSYQALQIHRNSASLWGDIVFAHKLIDFLTQFLSLPPISSLDPELSQYIAEEYPQAFDRLKRFYFRLMCSVLLEATAFQNYYANASHSASFESIQGLVGTHMAFQQNRSLQKALSTYLEGKTKQWDFESTDITQAMKKSVATIGSYLDTCIKTPMGIHQSQMVLICPYIHAALSSIQANGNAQVIQSLQAVLLKAAKAVKTLFLNHSEAGPALSLIPDAKISSWFTEGLTKPSSWALSPIFFHKVHQYIDLEIVSREKVNQTLNADSDSFRNAAEDAMMQELEFHQLAHSKFTKTWSNLVQQAEIRRTRNQVRKKELSSQYESAWKNLLRQITNSRGPWSTQKPEKEYWKIETKETHDRRRMKLIRSYGNKTAIEKACALNEVKPVVASKLEPVSALVVATPPSTKAKRELTTTAMPKNLPTPPEKKTLPPIPVGPDTSVSKLRQILESHGLDSSDCVEKNDLLEKITVAGLIMEPGSPRAKGAIPEKSAPRPITSSPTSVPPLAKPTPGLQGSGGQPSPGGAGSLQHSASGSNLLQNSGSGTPAMPQSTPPTDGAPISPKPDRPAAVRATSPETPSPSPRPPVTSSPEHPASPATISRALSSSLSRGPQRPPSMPPPITRTNEENLDALLALKLKPKAKGASDQILLEDDFEEINVEPSIDPIAPSLDDKYKKDDNEKERFAAKCQWIKGINFENGDFEITTKAIYFRNLEKMIFRTIPVDQITRIYRRRYTLRNNAIEFFTKKNKSYFFAFDTDTVKKVLKAIIKLRPPHLENYFSESPKTLLKKTGITDLWRRRQISNFEYIMAINTIAGRTYNDLSQYPVFPWILADYTSEKLDLNNPAIYRDLSKPIGAQNPARLEKLIERYDSFGAGGIDTPPFLYGSHYSSPGIVLHYLVRMEPFTSQFLKLQDGKFDTPVRMFWSIPNTWRNCLENSNDFKELIPEFFYHSSFLTNINQLDLGTQSLTGLGEPIANVILPPWANGSADNFIQIHRSALESEYVSAHLHEWIDLIFGDKQEGQQAVNFHNVFHYLTYEGSVDIDSITDPLQQKAVIDQIRNFGQTPKQVFGSPHPPRLDPESAQRELMSAGEAFSEGISNLMTSFSSSPVVGLTQRASSALHVTKGGSNKLSNSGPVETRRTALEFCLREKSQNIPLVHIYTYRNDRVVMVFADGYMIRTSIKAFTVKEPNKVIVATPEKGSTPKFTFVFSHTIGVNHITNIIAFTNEANSIISGGHWDYSLQIHNMGSTDLAHQLFPHNDVISALCLSSDMSILATGSSDCSCLIWDAKIFSPQKWGEENRELRPKTILYGHDEAITSIQLNIDLDLIATGSTDSTVILYNLEAGSYLRTIKLDFPVFLVKIADNGFIVTYTSNYLQNKNYFIGLNEKPPVDLFQLYVHSMNGVLLKTINLTHSITTMLITDDSEYLIVGSDTTAIVYSLSIQPLEFQHEFRCKQPIYSLAMLPSTRESPARSLLIGLDGSQLKVVKFLPSEFRKRRDSVSAEAPQPNSSNPFFNS